MARKPKSRSEDGRFLPAHAEPGPGRDSLYTPEMNDQARKLALLGMTDAEVAAFFGVAERTLNRWKLDHPAFCHALNEGKIAADANVAESLYKRATGEFIHMERAVKGDDGKYEILTLKSWQPGDPGAAKLWLTNRQPTKWRDKQAVELSNPDGSLTPKPLDVSKLSIEALRELMGALDGETPESDGG